jgi:hypothetical protein
MEYDFYMDIRSTIHHEIIFSPRPLNGYYRFQDRFQIIPHNNKIILEYDSKYYEPIKYINDAMDNNSVYRENIKSINHKDYLKELIAILSILCNAEFDYTEKESDDYKLKNSFSNDFLECHNFQDIQKVHIIHMDMIPIDMLFLSIEKCADKYFENYFNLTKRIKDRYLMSVFLYYNSSKIRMISPSMAYVALVSSIENMCGLEAELDGIKFESCEKCGNQIYKLSKRFREFVMKYSLKKNNNGNFKKNINDVYSLRSKIAHAGELLYMDYAGSEFSMKEYMNYNILMKYVRVCLYNWIVLTIKDGKYSKFNI